MAVAREAADPSPAKGIPLGSSLVIHCTWIHQFFSLCLAASPAVCQVLNHENSTICCGGMGQLVPLLVFLCERAGTCRSLLAVPNNMKAFLYAIYSFCPTSFA